MSLRGRLVAAVTVVTAVTLGGAFATVSALVNRDQERQLDHALRALAEEEAREVNAGASLLISDRPGPAVNSVGPLPKYGAIYDAHGNVLHASFPDGPPPLAALPASRRGCFDFRSQDSHLRGVAVELKGRSGHTLLLAAPREDLDGDAAFLARAMAAVWVVAVTWAAAVASWVVRRLVRGHQAIAETARRVASGDLGARVAVRSSDAEVAQLAADINKMIERISGLVQSQQRFIAHAAHELRTPLASLLGELSHALRRPRDAAVYRAAIEEALDATRRLKLLSEDLLALARIDAVRGEEGTAEVELYALIDAAVDLVQAEAREQEVTITIDNGEHAADPSAVTLRGWPLDLQRMLRNLLENAIRHSPRGGAVGVSAHVLPAVAGGYRGIELRIRDHGPGIPLEERARVFEPFYRGPAEQAKARPGAGLGLSIAREIARAHGGDLHIASDSEGGGAILCVNLPTAAAPTAFATRPTELGAPTVRAATGTRS